jgi:hypothetical protein
MDADSTKTPLQSNDPNRRTTTTTTAFPWLMMLSAVALICVGAFVSSGRPMQSNRISMALAGGRMRYGTEAMMDEKVRQHARREGAAHLSSCATRHYQSDRRPTHLRWS